MRLFSAALQPTEMLVSEWLPQETLENVKDLTLKLRSTGNNELQWPETWDQLTSITRLELNWQQHVQYGIVYILPAIRLESLINFQIIMRYDQADISGEEYIKSLICCLPLLSKMQVTIEGLTLVSTWLRDHPLVRQNAEKAETERKCLDAICIAVQTSTPGLEYKKLDMGNRFYSRQLYLEFKLQS